MRSGHRWIALASLLAVACAGALRPVFALDRVRRIDQFVHQAWTTEQGLPQNSIYAVIQTRDGYLWLGTDEGLVRFDGLRFTVFDRLNTPALRDQFVFSLHESPDGSLWVGTDRGGLARLHGGRFDHFGAERGLPAGRVQAIADDASGGLCVGLRGAGLACLIGDRFTTYRTRDGLASDNVLALLSDRRGRLWVGTDVGLDLFEAGRFIHFTTRDGLTPGGVRALLEDHAGRLWVGTIDGALGARLSGGGLSTFDGRRFEPVSQVWRAPSTGVMAIVEDRDRTLWLGTAGGGMARLTAGRIETWGLGESTADQMVYSIAEDAEGSLWVGTQPGGLHRLRNSKFTAYTKKDGLTDDVIESLHEDRQGAIWIGTHAGGLCRLTRGVISAVVPYDGSVSDRVNAIVEDADGSFWFGTERGLSHLHDGAVAQFGTRDGLPVAHVNALLLDRHGTLWIGTWGGGLARMHSGRIEPYPGDAASHQYVNTLFESRSGDLWIGTTDGLLVRTDRGLTDMTSARGFPVSVEAIHEDSDGLLWFGTRREGLYRYDGRGLMQYTVRNGLFDNLVGTIVEDDRGNFWMTCNKGIFMVPRRQLLDVADGRRLAVEPRAFDTADGMKNRECDFGQGSIRTRDGRLWFATVGGVVSIDPAQIETNAVPPPVSIEEVDADGEALPGGSTATISSGRRHLDFRFVGLSFAAPARVRYRYTLEGFDRTWIDGGDTRAAHYTNLPPGSYRFRVTAANNDGVWNPDGASYAFMVASPLWRRPWFDMVVVGAVWLLLLALSERRVAALRRTQAMQDAFSRQLISLQEHERKRIAGELHDGIGQHLLVIGNWARLAMNALGAPDRARPPLEVIAETAAQSIREIRAMTHDLQPYELEHIGLAEALHAMLRRVSEASRIAIATDIDSTVRTLPGETAINLYRIAQELVNNIVRHAHATEATVALRRTAGGLVLTVADNGTGLQRSAQPDGKRRGFGLRSLEARTRILGGSQRIESVPGQGTTICVEVPLSAEGAAHGG